MADMLAASVPWADARNPDLAAVAPTRIFAVKAGHRLILTAA